MLILDLFLGFLDFLQAESENGITAIVETIVQNPGKLLVSEFCVVGFLAAANWLFSKGDITREKRNSMVSQMYGIIVRLVGEDENASNWTCPISQCLFTDPVQIIDRSSGRFCLPRFNRAE